MEQPTSSERTAKTGDQRRMWEESLRADLPAMVGLAIIAALALWSARAERRASVLEANVREISPRIYQVTSSEFLVHFQKTTLQSIVVYLAVALVLIAIVVLWERLPLASIGLRKPSVRDLAASLGAFVLALPIAFALHLLRFPRQDPRLLAILLSLPLSTRLAMVGSAWFFEEVAERGFLIERVETLTGSTGVAIASSCCVMSLMHAGWGWSGALAILPDSLIFAVLYVWRRNPWACMLLHFIQDSPLLWLPWLMRKAYG
jgi:CAAX protease family protein